jgi:glycosyltransferase involved in cell wall biosynthesis
VDQNFKIAFCIPSLGSGGAERVTSVLANKFVERGYEVSIIMLVNNTCVYPLSEKVLLECLNCADDEKLSFVKRYSLRLKKISNAVKKISPNVVISFMSETNIDVCFALWGMNIPIIVSERNDPATDPSSKIKQIMRRIAYRKPKGFVFQTPDAQAYFSRKIQKRSKIILNPLTCILPKPFNEEREKRIVAVGRLNKQKNFPMLIDAFYEFSKKHTDYVLEIYGEGALEGRLNEYILSKDLKEKVLLKGFCKDVHEKTLSASLFVMSSDFEGMPNALLEAMAIGLPCISTDCPCGGPRMLITPYENGILVPVNDSKKMLDAMNYMIENPDKAKEMSLKAVAVRDRAKVDTITDEWIKIIDLCKEN